MDAERIPVYVNIADALVELGRTSEAIPYYQYYLETYPGTPLRDRILEFMTEHQ